MTRDSEEIEVDLELGRSREPSERLTPSRPLTPSASYTSLTGIMHVVSVCSYTTCLLVACAGVWAARADYLPTALEPREMHSLLLPRQPMELGAGASAEEVVVPRRLSLQGEEEGRLSLQGEEEGRSGGGGGTESQEIREETDTSVKERDRVDLEREVRDALFKGGVGSQSTEKKKPRQSHDYRGRPLLGAWATSGQTGAGVVQKPGEPGNFPPAKFSIHSSGSSVASSGHTTPSQPGTRTPNYRDQQTPPRQQNPNWSTPRSGQQYRGGGRGRLAHSHSGPEKSLHNPSPPTQHRTTRRYNSEQYPGSDESYHPMQSHDRTNQSHPSNWNVHSPRNPDRRNDGGGRGRVRERGRGRGRGRGRDEGSNWQGRTDSENTKERFGSREGDQKDSGSYYQRSRSDATGRPLTRGAFSSSAKRPYSEPAMGRRGGRGGR